MVRGKKSGNNQRGGSRGRGGTGKGRGGGGRRGGRRGGYQSFPPSSGYQTPEDGILSMVQTARQTGSHDHKAWGSTVLRSQPVVFVSAGSWDPSKDLQTDDCDEDAADDHRGEDIEDDEDHQPPQTRTEPHAPSEEDLNNTGHDDQERQEHQPQTPVALTDNAIELAARPLDVVDINAPEEPVKAIEPVGFFFDVTKRSNSRTAEQPPIETVPSTPEPNEGHDTDSSDEVILFKGRDAARRQQFEQIENLSMARVEQEITIVETEMRQDINIKEDSYPRPRYDTAPDTLEISSQRQKRKSKKSRDTGTSDKNRRSVSSDDALIADYIENMRATGEDQDLFALLQNNQRDLGGLENAEVLPDQSTSDAALEDMDSVSEPSDDDWPLYGTVAYDEKKALHEQKHRTDIVSAEQEVEDGILAQILQQFGSDEDEDDEDEDDIDTWPVQTLDTFDPMDWERPSLRRKKGKGNKARLQVDISDSELEQTLQAAWKNDRMKKAERKKQREEMRALGLLGKKADPEDLRVKYPSGMGVEQVGEEIRLFLNNSKEQIELPPMDKHARKMIHELANKFNIKSKSTGDGNSRRPTLYKSKRTLAYSETAFNSAISRMHRKYFPRLDAKRRAAAPRTIGQGRVSSAAATVRDGEMVGAAAPELGVDNRGRAMLEKMGWSKGTALGAMDNKGILQPVSHAMKRTKAGLA